MQETTAPKPSKETVDGQEETGAESQNKLDMKEQLNRSGSSWGDVSLPMPDDEEENQNEAEKAATNQELDNRNKSRLSQTSEVTFFESSFEP